MNLPTGSTITYVVTANIGATAAGTLSDMMSVAAPFGVVDPTPADNTATDSDTFSTSSTSGVWSGYAITPSSLVSAVGGTWVVPAITSAGSSQVSIWVGIDGQGTTTVEQTGIAWTTSGWVPWIEFFGDAKGPVPPSSNKALYYSQTNITAATFPGTSVPNWTITTGDTISASVTWNSDPTVSTSTFTFVFQDTTQNQNWTGQLTTSYIKAARGSGEWIVESPSGATKPLAAFGTANFSGMGNRGRIHWARHRVHERRSGDDAECRRGGGTTTFSGITNSASPGPLQPGAAPVRVSA